MQKSWIVYGPQGSGKTMHARAIAGALGLDPARTVDEWDGRQCTFKGADTLHLTTDLPAWAEGSRRVLSIDQALAAVVKGHPHA
jgi:replication-associated recombination protein RarA